MQMVQKSFYIDKPTYSELSQVASAQNLATAELMRRLIKSGLNHLKAKPLQTTTFLQKLSAYPLKGPKDLAKNLDKYVWD